MLLKNKTIPPKPCALASVLQTRLYLLTGFTALAKLSPRQQVSAPGACSWDAVVGMLESAFKAS